MQAPFLLLAQTPTNSLQWTLIWAFIVAFAIWWIIWLLLHDRNTAAEATLSTSKEDASAPKEDSSASKGDGSAAVEKDISNTSPVSPDTAKPSAPDTKSTTVEPKETPMAAATSAAAEAAAAAAAGGTAATALTSPPSTSKKPEADSLPKIMTASAEQAAEQFKSEIDAGSARLDDAYGVVYTAAPDDPDDLKRIKGIGKVLEGKLNGHGVHKFRQIAFWTDPAVEEFSKLLTNFKDRIYRDDWIDQAKKLHEEKYGKKL